MEWFLYDRELRQERAKRNVPRKTSTAKRLKYLADIK